MAEQQPEYLEKQLPYVDPNSGAAHQPGGYAVTAPVEEDAEDPNPDEGGTDAVFAEEGEQMAIPDGDPLEEGEDPNPDEGEVDAVFAEDGQKEATPDGDPLEEGEDPNPDPGGVEAVFYTPDPPELEELEVDGASPDEAEDAEPGADEQTGGPQTEGEPPAGNASRDAWADYARSQGASEDDLDGLGRDEIRDLYS